MEGALHSVYFFTTRLAQGNLSYQVYSCTGFVGFKGNVAMWRAMMLQIFASELGSDFHKQIRLVALVFWMSGKHHQILVTLTTDSKNVLLGALSNLAFAKGFLMIGTC